MRAKKRQEINPASYPILGFYNLLYTFFYLFFNLFYNLK